MGTSTGDSRHIDTFEDDSSPDLHNWSSIKNNFPDHVKEEDAIGKVNCSEHATKDSVRIHTQQQTEYHKTLQESFLVNRYPDSKEKNRLVEKLGVSVTKISKWFEKQALP